MQVGNPTYYVSALNARTEPKPTACSAHKVLQCRIKQSLPWLPNIQLAIQYMSACNANKAHPWTHHKDAHESPACHEDVLHVQMRAEPSLADMKDQELKKAVMPFAQMRMKEANLLGPEVCLSALLCCCIADSLSKLPSCALLLLVAQFHSNGVNIFMGAGLWHAYLLNILLLVPLHATVALAC